MLSEIKSHDADLKGEEEVSVLTESTRVPLLEGERALAKRQAEKRSTGRLAQTIFVAIGLGSVAVYIQPGKDCAADPECVGPVLATLPLGYREAALIAGGTGFAMTSAMCALKTFPKLLEYTQYYLNLSGPRVKKADITQAMVFDLFKRGVVLVIAGVATIETLLIAVKESPSFTDALLDPSTWVLCAAMYPIYLHGVMDFIYHDAAHFFSKLNQKLYRYRGAIKSTQDDYYVKMRSQYVDFRVNTQNKFSQLVALARSPILTEEKFHPIVDLYLNVKEDNFLLRSDSDVKRFAKSILSVIGIAAGVGSVLPISVNTYRFVSNWLTGENESNSLSIGAFLLSMLFGCARMRTVIGQTVSGVLTLADWRPSQHLQYQLHPKTTIASWLLFAPLMAVSYAAAKEAILQNFQTSSRQGIADWVAYSVALSHFIFSLKLVHLILARFSKNYLYKIEEQVEELVGATLESFDDFREMNVGNSILNIERNSSDVAAGYGVDSNSLGSLFDSKGALRPSVFSSIATSNSQSTTPYPSALTRYRTLQPHGVEEEPQELLHARERHNSFVILQTPRSAGHPVLSAETPFQAENNLPLPPVDAVFQEEKKPFSPPMEALSQEKKKRQTDADYFEKEGSGLTKQEVSRAESDNSESQRHPPNRWAHKLCEWFAGSRRLTQDGSHRISEQGEEERRSNCSP